MPGKDSTVSWLFGLQIAGIKSTDPLCRVAGEDKPQGCILAPPHV